MDLQTIRARVAEQIGVSDSLSGQMTRYNSWINETYKRVAGAANWPWLLKNDIVQASADITTGTVSINSADTALTFSSAPSVSVANDWRIQFADSDDWYDITSHTASSTSATLSDGYTASSNLSAGTYTLRRFYYSLASDVDRILSVKQARSDVKLTYVDSREFDIVLADPTSTGNPTTYLLPGLDSSNNWRINFFPFPSAKMNIDVRYYKTVTELSANTDEPIFPKKWHEILIWGALATFGFSYRDDTRQKEAIAVYSSILGDMKRNLKPTTDQIVVIQPWDRRTIGGIIRTPLFPPEYGAQS